MNDNANNKPGNEPGAKSSNRSLPGYALKKKLGAGAMASVYLARDDKLHRDVALKVMSKKLLADPSFVDRFLREARIVASVSHRNIVTVFDVGSHNDFHYMAMEFLPGGDLSTRLKQGVSLQEGIDYIIDIAEGLHYAASKNLIHRDIKPDNIMFAEDGHAVITDFGIARDASSETNMTMTGSVIGTPQYMSPEQAAAKQLDHRSDLYSLGIILYQILAGSTPFKGDSAISTGIMHITQTVPALPHKHRQFQNFIDKALAKNPDDRFQSGKEFIQALSKISLDADASDESDTDASMFFDAVEADSNSPGEPTDFLADLSDEFLATAAPVSIVEAESEQDAEARKALKQKIKSNTAAYIAASSTTQNLSLTKIEEDDIKVPDEVAQEKTGFKLPVLNLSGLRLPSASLVVFVLLFLVLMGTHIFYVNVLGRDIPFQKSAAKLNQLTLQASGKNINFSGAAKVLQSTSNGFGNLTAALFGNAVSEKVLYSELNQNEWLYLDLINKALEERRYYAPPMNNAEFYIQELISMEPESDIIKNKTDELMRISIKSISELLSAKKIEEAKLMTTDAERILPFVNDSDLRKEYWEIIETLN